MPKAIRFLLQALNYTVFMAVVWYFSSSPPFRQLDPDQAVIALAFAHSGQLREECIALTPEELVKLPPNKRIQVDCPRERSPITVDLLLDDKLAIQEVADPPGLYSDQGVQVYRTVKVPAGTYHLAIAMNDNVRVEGPTHTHEQTVSLEPTQLLLVDFNSDNSTFVIK